MSKVQIKNYTFDASLGKVTLIGRNIGSTDYATIDLDSVIVIANVSVLDPTKKVIYNYAVTGKGGSVATNVLTLEYDTTAMSDTDKLQIWYWDADIGETIDNFPASYAVTGTFWQVTQPVSGTFWQATQPVSGPLTDTQLRATAVPISGTVTANTGLTQPLTDTQLRATAVPISGTITANAGTNLNTSLLALEAGGNLAGIAYTLELIRSADGIKKITDALPAGSAIIGKFGIDQTTPGTTNKVSIGTDGVVAIGAGSAVIGHVIADSGSTTAVTGDVTIIQGTASNLNMTEASAASILTSAQLIDDIVYIDDTSTHSTGASKGALMMAAATPTDTSVNSNDIGAVAMTTDRKLFVSVRDALPIGSSVIGKVSIDQATPGTTNLVALTAETTKVIGTINVAASQTIAVTNTGTFAVQSASTLSAETTKVIGTINVAAGQTIAVTNAGTFAVQSASTLAAETTKIIGTVNIAAAQTIAVTNAGTFAVQSASTLAAETTKVIGVVRTSDGAGNLLTSNSTTYTAKFGLDSNLLGTLGTAFSTAGKVDVKAADGDVFVRQATASNLNATVVGTGTFVTQSTLAAETTKVIGTVNVAAAQTIAVTNTGTFATQSTPVTQADTFMLGGVNVKEINAVAPLMGSGIMGTGSLRVTIASDNDALTVKQATATNLKAEVVGTGTFVTQSTLAAETTKVIGTVNIAGSQTIAVTNTGTFAVQSAATLAAETTKVIGVTRTSDGAGNLLTSNSTTYTAKFGLDANILGTLGTAFSTAGKVDIKAADGDAFVRQTTASNLNMTEASAANILTKLTAGVASMVKLEDVGSNDADAGVPAMFVRKSTPANTSGSDADYEFLQGNNGALWTSNLSFFVTVSTDVTRQAADTTTYGINDAISDSTSAPTSGGFTFTSAARKSGGSGIITDAIFTSSADPALLLAAELWIFNTSVTNVNDNVAFAISDAEIKTLVGVIPFTLTDAGTNNSCYHAQNLSIGFTCSGTANLRFLLKAKNAYIPVGSEVITSILKIIQID